jgi:hypothetical protein
MNKQTNKWASPHKLQRDETQYIIIQNLFEVCLFNSHKCWTLFTHYTSGLSDT